MSREGAPITEFVEDPRLHAPEILENYEDDKPQDNCGVIAIIAPGQPVGDLIYDGMQCLQHRGQSGAGVAYPLGHRLIMGHNGNGLIDKAVPDMVPQPGRMNIIDAGDADMAIGHVRYSTSENNNASQPFVGVKYGSAIAHNGHWEKYGPVTKRYHVNMVGVVSDSDALNRTVDEVASERDSLEEALVEVLPHVDGAYSLTLTDGERIFGARDPWGTHPLCIGRLPDGGHVIASENIAFKPLKAEFVRDVEPGEIVSIDKSGTIKSTFIDRQEPLRQCMFEYIYIARPESTINGINVARAREYMGEYLAKEIPRHRRMANKLLSLLGIHKDVLVGVPRSGLYAADGYERVSGIKQVRGLIDDRYVGRSFIERQGKREDILRRKFTVDTDLVNGKRVWLKDDSLIKGSTMKGQVAMFREAGAKEVHVLLAAPEYLHPCYGGMDTRDTSRLMARGRTNEQIAEEIGADSVTFNSIENVEKAVSRARVDKSTPARIGSYMCMGCVIGEYPYPVPPEDNDELDLVELALTT